MTTIVTHSPFGDSSGEPFASSAKQTHSSPKTNDSRIPTIDLSINHLSPRGTPPDQHAGSISPRPEPFRPLKAGGPPPGALRSPSKSPRSSGRTQPKAINLKKTKVKDQLRAVKIMLPDLNWCYKRSSYVFAGMWLLCRLSLFLCHLTVYAILFAQRLVYITNLGCFSSMRFL